MVKQLDDQLLKRQLQEHAPLPRVLRMKPPFAFAHRHVGSGSLDQPRILAQARGDGLMQRQAAAFGERERGHPRILPECALLVEEQLGPVRHDLSGLLVAERLVDAGPDLDATEQRG